MVAPSKKAKRNQKKRQNRKKKQQQQREQEEEEEEAERLQITKSIPAAPSFSEDLSSVDEDDGGDNDGNNANENIEDDKSSIEATSGFSNNDSTEEEQKQDSQSAASQIENPETGKEAPAFVTGSRNDSDVNLLDHIPEDSRSISTPTRTISSTNSSIKEEEEEEEIEQEQETNVESSKSSQPPPSLALPETATTNREEEIYPTTTPTSSSSEENVLTTNTQQLSTNDSSPSSSPNVTTPLSAIDTTTTSVATVTAETETTEIPTMSQQQENNLLSPTSTICSSQNEQDQHVTTGDDGDDTDGDIEDLVELESSPGPNKFSSDDISTVEQNPAPATAAITSTGGSTGGGLGLMRGGGGSGINLRLGLGMMTIGSGPEGGTTSDTKAEGENGEEKHQELNQPLETEPVASTLSSVATTAAGETLSIGTIQTEESQDENENFVDDIDIDTDTTNERYFDDTKDDNQSSDNVASQQQQPMDANVSAPPSTLATATTTTTIDGDAKNIECTTDDKPNEGTMTSPSTSTKRNNAEIVQNDESISKNFPTVNSDVTNSKTVTVDRMPSSENSPSSPLPSKHDLSPRDNETQKEEKEEKTEDAEATTANSPDVDTSSPLPSTDDLEPVDNDTKKKTEEVETEDAKVTTSTSPDDHSKKEEKEDKKSSWSELLAVSKSLPQHAMINDLESTPQGEKEESEKQDQQPQPQQPEDSSSDKVALPTATVDEETADSASATVIKNKVTDKNDESNDNSIDSDASSKIQKQSNDDGDSKNNISPTSTKEDVNEIATEKETPPKQEQQQRNKDKLSPWDSMKLLMTDMESLLADSTEKEDETKSKQVVEKSIQREESDNKCESSSHTLKDNENDVTGITSTSTSSSSSVLTEDEIKVTAMIDMNSIIASEDFVGKEEEEEGDKSIGNHTTTMTLDSNGQTEVKTTVIESMDVKSNETDGHRVVENEDLTDPNPAPQDSKDDLDVPTNADADLVVSSEAAHGGKGTETHESSPVISPLVVYSEPYRNQEAPTPEMSNEKGNQETPNKIQETTSSIPSPEKDYQETPIAIEEIKSLEPKDEPIVNSDADTFAKKDAGGVATKEQSEQKTDQQTPSASPLTGVERDEADENSAVHDVKGAGQSPDSRSDDLISQDSDVGARKGVTLDPDRTLAADAECQAISESTTVDVQPNENCIEKDQRPSAIDQPTPPETKEEDIAQPIYPTLQSDEDTACKNAEDMTIKSIAASDSATTVAEKSDFGKNTVSSSTDDETKKDALLVDLKDALASFRQKKADIEALVLDCEKDPNIEKAQDSQDIKDSSSGKVNIVDAGDSAVQGISNDGKIDGVDPQCPGNGVLNQDDNLVGNINHSPRHEDAIKEGEELHANLERNRENDRTSVKEQVTDSPSPIQETNKEPKNHTVTKSANNGAGEAKNVTPIESSISEKQEVVSHILEGSKSSETPIDCFPDDCTPASPTHHKRSAIISSVSTRIDCLQATSQANKKEESMDDQPKNFSTALPKANSAPASVKRDELAAALLENQLPSSVDSGSIQTVTIEFFDEAETSTIGDRTLSPIGEQALSRVSHSDGNEDNNKREDLPPNKTDDLVLSIHSVPNGRPIEQYSPITPKIGVSTRLPPVPLSAPPKLRSRFAFSKPKKVNRLAQIIRTELWSEDIKIVEAALSELEKLAEKDSATIARTGGILAIVQVMEHHIDQPSIQVAACQALEKLALDHENEVAISEVGGLEAVISSMMANFEDDTVHEAAWSALWNLTCHHADLSIDIEDGLQALTSCMTQHAQQPSVQRNACGTLANLCQSPDRLKALRNAGGFVAIATALETHWDDEQVRQEASNALTTLLEPHADTYELHLEEESPSMYKFTPIKSKVPCDPPDAPDP